jgi:hypothetical protein
LSRLGIECPECGASHTLRNPGITVLVCEFCSTTIYREEAGLRAGSKSILGEPPSGLNIADEGKIRGQRIVLWGRAEFQVFKEVGGIQKSTAIFEEWYVEDEKGESCWLVEDAKTYSLVREIDEDIEGVGPDLKAGEILRFEDQDFMVDEVGRAKCLGGQGQLPRTIQVGEEYIYVDATEVNGTRSLSLEFSPDDPEPDVFLGEHLTFDELQFDRSDWNFPTRTEKATSLKCPSCDAQIEFAPQGDPLRTLGCSFCNSVLELDGKQAKVLGRNPGNTPAHFPFKIGTKGHFQGADYEIVGRCRYSEEQIYFTDEYLLWNEEAGYLWLESYERDFQVLRPTKQGPEKSSMTGLAPKDKIEIIPGDTFRFYESGTVKLIYVDGALPWLAELGERSKYWDFIKPPKVYSMEQTGDELERFIGHHVAPEEVYAAFAPKEFVPEPRQKAPTRLNPIQGRHWLYGWVFFFFALGNCIVGIPNHEGEGIGVSSFPVDRYDAQTRLFSGEHVSSVFTVPTHADVLSIRVSSGVYNSWTFVSYALVDEAGKTLLGGGTSEVSYYHGGRGEDAWSEGSGENHLRFKAPPPGSYRLMLEGEAAHLTSVVARVFVNSRTGLLNVYLGVLMLLYMAYVIVRYRHFESKRWAPVVGDDDDDDFDDDGLSGAPINALFDSDWSDK